MMKIPSSDGDKKIYGTYYHFNSNHKTFPRHIFRKTCNLHLKFIAVSVIQKHIQKSRKKGVIGPQKLSLTNRNFTVNLSRCSV